MTLLSIFVHIQQRFQEHIPHADPNGVWCSEGKFHMKPTAQQAAEGDLVAIVFIAIAIVFGVLIFVDDNGPRECQ